MKNVTDKLPQNEGLNIGVVMPSAIHINKKYDVVWYNDTVSKDKTGNEVISMINGTTPKIKEIKESVN